MAEPDCNRRGFSRHLVIDTESMYFRWKDVIKYEESATLMGAYLHELSCRSWLVNQIQCHGKVQLALRIYWVEDTTNRSENVC